jgi:Flp pilus assembly pilin Flp
MAPLSVTLRRCSVFLRKTGQGLAEYALILALIAIMAIAALMFLSDGINQILTDIGNAL